ncbi:hypothetical protein ASPWEDRAFT_23548 [Aspergillus wentii DTO 134E9]|uniref:Uncharacterized protein n=1 Tax=Aspergillus wentii DTO 134E9 TaxID=1073089 RepID=A0A1L9S2S8_ASPWE|nr:uncharacterized protein ASPWEDRAFT_23548 [Aspergillus wentii DTO 134E9]KAI9929806.1 hypothetical protein MW887_011611 [Aspergillus wentii]OJJ41461.1 hypothetical protein ASPWEDRAFT_23548 [Aspergillus wentii DTO 134E9]
MAEKRKWSCEQFSIPRKKEQLNKAVTNEEVSSQESETLSSSPDRRDTGNEECSSSSTTTTTIEDEHQQLPYTDDFFSDMAKTIAKLFPFEAFAKKHQCGISEVSQAISAVVISPLTDPEFALQKDEKNWSISEYGKRMIVCWNEQYRRRLEANALTKTPSNSKLTKTNAENISKSISPSDDSDVPSSPLTHGHPQLPTSKSAKDHNSKTNPIEILEEDEPSLGGENSSLGEEKSHPPQPATPKPKRPPLRPAKRSWQPPTPVVRQHVRRDCFGNFEPVPPEEEIMTAKRRRLNEEGRFQRLWDGSNAGRGDFRSQYRGNATFFDGASDVEAEKRNSRQSF